MRWGLIARAETDRGLGIQSLGIYQNLKPDKTLVIDVPQSGFASHIENYPDAWKVTLDDGLGHVEDVLRDWWSDLDVIMSIETLYDDRTREWANADGVRTIIQGNPEFVRPTGHPDVWWWPTKWRTDLLPPGELISVPVPDQVRYRAGDLDNAPVFLHIAGNRAMGDRNGTFVVKNAVKGLDRRAFLRSYCQKGDFDMHRVNQRAIELPPVADRWEMYNDAHVLVLPRRFGGLCLPVLEALASGVVPMMSDCSPNTDWPIIPLPSEASKCLSMPAGEVQTFDVLSTDLRVAMNRVAGDLTVLKPYRERAAEWATQNNWTALAPRYHDALEAAARS